MPLEISLTLLRASGYWLTYAVQYVLWVHNKCTLRSTRRSQARSMRLALHCAGRLPPLSRSTTPRWARRARMHIRPFSSKLSASAANTRTVSAAHTRLKNRRSRATARIMRLGIAGGGTDGSAVDSGSSHTAFASPLLNNEEAATAWPPVGPPAMDVTLATNKTRSLFM